MFNFGVGEFELAWWNSIGMNEQQTWEGQFLTIASMPGDMN